MLYAEIIDRVPALSTHHRKILLYAEIIERVPALSTHHRKLLLYTDTIEGVPALNKNTENDFLLYAQTIEISVMDPNTNNKIESGCLILSQFGSGSKSSVINFKNKYVKNSFENNLFKN